MVGGAEQMAVPVATQEQTNALYSKWNQLLLEKKMRLQGKEYYGNCFVVHYVIT